MDLKESSADFRFPCLRRAREGDLRHGDAELLRDETHSFGKSNVLDFLDETEDIARGATSEAVVELPDGVYGERRRLLAMERTESGEVLGAGFLEFDIVSDDADDVRLLLKRLFEVVGGHQLIRSASIVGQASLKRNIAGPAWRVEKL